MDLLASERINETILTVDAAATKALNAFVTSLVFRNPQIKDSLVDGYGGSGGKLLLRIRYRLLQHDEIERFVTATFTTDIGEPISESSTIVVEKIP